MAISKMLEGYCADVEHLMRDTSVREALRLAIALPEICSALESPRLRSSPEDYMRWCESWLKYERHGPKLVTGSRLYALLAREAPPVRVLASTDPRPQALVRLRMRRNVRTHRGLERARISKSAGRLEAFRYTLCDALLTATRSWYEHYGRDDSVVQANLGKLAIG
jgi:hypothetical protein